MAINNPDTLARARHQLALISYADDNDRAHSWYTHAVGWVNALLAERLIDDDTNAQLLTEAARLKEEHRRSGMTRA
jgi:hypothetical protein